MPPELRRALQWWMLVLIRGLCERREWKTQRGDPAHLFCDARGHPAHLGAVLFIDDRCCFTQYEPPANLVDMFKRRRDNQIMGLELLSISLGLCTFEDLLRGRNVIVHSDNTGSEVSPSPHVFRAGVGIPPMLQAAIRRGTAISMDHAQLVHSQWTQAAEQGLNLYVLRVGTHDNIADLPSREASASGGARANLQVMANRFCGRRWTCYRWPVQRCSHQCYERNIGIRTHGKYCK